MCEHATTDHTLAVSTAALAMCFAAVSTNGRASHDARNVRTFALRPTQRAASLQTFGLLQARVDFVDTFRRRKRIRAPPQAFSLRTTIERSLDPPSRRARYLLLARNMHFVVREPHAAEVNVKVVQPIRVLLAKVGLDGS